MPRPIILVSTSCSCVYACTDRARLYAHMQGSAYVPSCKRSYTHRQTDAHREQALPYLSPFAPSLPVSLPSRPPSAPTSLCVRAFARARVFSHRLFFSHPTSLPPSPTPYLPPSLSLSLSSSLSSSLQTNASLRLTGKITAGDGRSLPLVESSDLLVLYIYIYI
jgi:hypothetical protein